MAKSNPSSPAIIGAAKKPGPVPQESKSAKGASTTGETVTVACKMPHGIVIHREVRKTRMVNVLGGGAREEVYYDRVEGSEIVIYGNARPVGGDFRTRTVAGFALTQGVPKDVWDRWRENNKDMPAVRNGLIFAYSTTALAADAAKSKDNRALKSGLEPLDPNGDPRRPRPLSAQVGQVTTRDDVTHEFEQVDEEA